LSGAKAELDKANKLSESVSKEVPKHEYSNAPYSLVKKPVKSYGVADEASDAGKGIKARLDMKKKLEQ
jgi:hypothetical protein